jgi:hypothetical protein
MHRRVANFSHTRLRSVHRTCAADVTRGFFAKNALRVYAGSDGGVLRPDDDGGREPRATGDTGGCPGTTAAVTSSERSRSLDRGRRSGDDGGGDAMLSAAAALGRLTRRGRSEDHMPEHTRACVCVCVCERERERERKTHCS